MEIVGFSFCGTKFYQLLLPLLQLQMRIPVAKYKIVLVQILFTVEHRGRSINDFCSHLQQVILTLGNQLELPKFKNTKFLAIKAILFERVSNYVGIIKDAEMTDIEMISKNVLYDGLLMWFKGHSDDISRV